ncbi:MAG: hypothetical protein D0433_09180 [Candidatus Thermochlorobacter aerophilum]|jgi:hypothetical protein|uniref:J domain-containing protein n=1 Tax=Candidatus Thermochlorobacter aerophilus TaxID=1868324 RepID=A0A395M1J8_9BACT|nr:MAG: hypothetical protein D0433_09180 [Candidatus Thermochlorobacter aerophilum]
MSVLSRLIKVLKAYHYANLKRDRWTEAKLEELLKDIEQQYNQAREKAYYTYQSYRRAQEEKKQWQHSAHYGDEFYRQYQHTHDQRKASGSEESASYYASGIDSKIAGYYANLEIPYGSDLETVRRAWRKMVAKYHPDKFAGNPEKQQIATELTKGINRAYEELTKYLSKK